jgi:acetyltransferase-like isoleucine patch superfamily enzyme
MAYTYIRKRFVRLCKILLIGALALFHKFLFSLLPFHKNKLDELNYLRKELQNGHNWINPDGIEFGDFSYGHPYLYGFEREGLDKIKIGKFCSVADDVTIMLSTSRRTDWIATYPFNYIKETPQKKDVIIGNDVWIGIGVRIMPGTSIGDGCVIGANALVTKSMPDYSICGGVPAKVIRKRFSEDIIEKLKMIRWWDWPYENVCEVIPLLQSDKIELLFDYYNNNIKSSNKSPA